MGAAAKGLEALTNAPLATDGVPVPVTFYAPMKSPDHPTPSGDREIARHLLTALGAAGARPTLASELRILDLEGDAEDQARLSALAEAEVARLVATRAGGARLWLTYHCHYKAPDLVGPAVCRALGLPYAIVEPSISPNRRDGPWARFAAASEAAIAAADRLFWTTTRDRPGLEAAGLGKRLQHLPPAVEPGPQPARLGQPAGTPLRLLAVGMMRPGDKVESYRRLARALPHLPGPWQLEIAGDGPARSEVEALFTPCAGMSRNDVSVRFRGALEGSAVRTAMEAADLLVWPGVGEGVGMVWLEAAAAGLPAVAEDGAAARDVLGAGLLAPGDDPAAFARAIQSAAEDRPALSHSARRKILAHHTPKAMSETLGQSLAALLR
ncbi:MAG: glycosyltransferase family 4 protein [Pseudomonadota bacterium]